MATIIGGQETGLFDSTHFLLNRNDQTRFGPLGSGKSSFVNIANGNLVIQQRDVYMPSLGEDFGLIRTYNSRGLPSDAHQHEDARWSFSTFVRLIERHDSDGRYFEVRHGDGSLFEFRLNPGRGVYESVDGAGAFETIQDLGATGSEAPSFVLTRADQTQLSFDKHGRLLSSVDTNGVRMEYIYASDRLVQVRDDTGHVIDYQYLNGTLHRLVDETGQVLVEYRYSSGRLSEVVNREGHSTKYFYTNDGFLNRILLPFQQDADRDGVNEVYETRELLIEYEEVNWRGDAHGNAKVVSSITDAEGGVTSFEYDFDFTTPGAASQDRVHLSRNNTDTITYHALETAALSTTKTITTTTSVPPYYSVQAGDTWESIAAALYGAAAAASALQAALGDPPLVAGAELTGLPATLSYSETVTVNVPPYYTVQAGDTWASVTQAVYGTTEPEAVQALQDALGGQTLSAGLHLEVPAELTYGIPASATADGSVLSTTDTETSEVEHGLDETALITNDTETTTDTRDLDTTALTGGAPAGWSGATLLESDAGAATLPSVGFDQNGNGFALWQSDGEVLVRRYDSATQAWTAPNILDSGSNTVDSPYLQVDASGNAIAVWIQSNGTSLTVWAARYSALDDLWSTAEALATNPATYFSLSASINANGHAVVTWVRDGVYATRYIDGAWQGVEAISSYNGTIPIASSPSAAIDSLGNIRVVWAQVGQYYKTPIMSNHYVAGTGWVGPFQLSSLGYKDLPTISFDQNGNAVALWVDMDANYCPVVRHYNQATNAWSDEIYLFGRPNSISDAQLVVDPSGDAVVAWVQSDGTANSVWVSLYDSVTNTWSTAETVEASSSSASKARAAINGDGEAVVAWLQSSDGTTTPTNVYVNRFRGDVWEGPESIESSASDIAASPAIAFDGEGKIQIVWQQSDGTAESIYTNRYNAVATDPYLVIQPGDTWESVAAALYGTAAAASELQAALGNPPLTAGEALTGLPATLEVTTTVTVPPYYAIQSGDTWASIATLLYGTSAVADQLQAALGNPALTAGERLNDLPATLTETVTTTVTVPAYYTVQTGDTWGSVAQTIYGTSAPGAVQALRDALGDPALAAGVKLTVPLTLDYVAAVTLAANGAVLSDTETQTVTSDASLDAEALSTTRTTTETVTVDPYYTVQAGDTWESIAIALYGTANATSALAAAFDNQALVAGEELTAFPASLSYAEPSTELATDKFFLGGTTRVVDGLGNARAYSNEAEHQAWRLANGFYALYDAGQEVSDAAYRAQVEAIRQGHSLTYTYGANGLITEVIDQHGFRTLYQYDARENLTAVTDRNGWGATHSDAPEYRRHRAALGYTDAAGNGKLAAELTDAEREAILAAFTTTFTYDERGNLLSRTDSERNRTAFTYTAFNKLASETTAVGHALVDSDDAIYQEKRLELGYPALTADLSAADRAEILARHTITYTYDAQKNLVERLDPGGDLTRFEYDAYGNLARRIVYLDAGDPADPAKQQLTQFFYDDFGNNIETIDAEGHRTRSEYDHFGNLVRFTGGNGGVTTYTYDNADRLLTVTDPEGFVTVNAYDAVGNRIAVTDANGHTVTRLYDRNNMLIAVIDPSETGPSQDRVIQHTYDVIGNRTAVTDAEGRTTEYIYNARRELVEVIAPEVAGADGAPRRYTSTFAYDGEGNRIRTTDNNGFTTEIAHTRTGLVREQVDPTGHVTRFVYDANYNRLRIVSGVQLPEAKRQILRFSYDEENQLIAQTDGEENVTRYEYDAPGNRAAVIDANGNRTDFEYDRNNRLLREIRPEVVDPDTAQPTRYTVLHQYDANGNEVATTDENGHTTRFTFDKDDRLVMVEDANGIKTLYAYDSRHNRTSVRIGVEAHVDADGRVVFDGALDAQATTFVYDEFNQLVARTDGVGNALVTSDSPLYRAMRRDLGVVDAAGEGKLVADLTDTERQALRAAHTEHYAYDRVGNQLSAIDHLGRTTAFRYDALNRVVEETDALSQSTAYRYDGNGNRTAVTDVLERTTTFAYDGMNRLVRTTDAIGVATARAYDAFGNLLEETRAADSAEARTARFEYDLNNRVTRRIDPEGHAETYRYDALGNRLEVVDRRGHGTQYVYDALNRNIKIIDPLAFETRFEYDGVGNRLAIVDARGGVTRFAYDPGNRRIETTDAEGRVTRFEYDVRGNRVLQTTAFGTPEAQTTAFEYDAENSLRAVIDAEGHRTEHGYDRVYNRVATTDGNGNTTAYAFDALNRNIEIVDAEGGRTTFAYDAVGNRLSRTDALGRVTTFAYDDVDRLIVQTDAHGTETRFGYDAVGNRIEMMRAHGTDEAEHTTYAYDLNDRLIAETDAIGNGLAESNSAEYQARRVELGFPADAGLLSEAQKADLRALHTTSYQYDPNGNRVEQRDALGRVTQYIYDANNRVTEIVDPLGHSTRYVYDGNGNRVEVIHALGHRYTTYYNANNEAVLYVDGAGAMTAYAYDANGNRVSMTRFAIAIGHERDPAVMPEPVPSAEDETTRYAYDELNRLVRAADPEGAVVDTRYDAVGNVLETRAYANRIAVDPSVPLAAQTPAAHPLDRATTFAYDDVNRLLRRVDPEGFVTGFSYDAVGNRLSETVHLSRTDFDDPALQQRRSFVYDDLNRLTSETSPIGVETRYAYDRMSNRLSMTTAAGTAEARLWSYEYDDANRRVRETNPEGTVTRWIYDAEGQAIERIDAEGLPEARITGSAYDGNGRLVERTNPDGTVTRYVYDAVGNLIEQIDAAGSGAERRTAYEYDHNHRMTRESIAPGTSDAIARTYTYDAFGNRKQEIIGAGTADERITIYAYDRNDRLVAETDGAGNVTLLDYDAFGNVLRRSITGLTLDPDGNAVERTRSIHLEYDGRDLLVREENGAGDVIVRTYDAAGNLRFETRGSGTADASTTEYRYDLANRMTQMVVDPVGLALTTRYEHDAHDNLITEINARGFRLTSEYDAMNRVVLTTDAAGFSVSFTYDRFGNQASITTGQYFGADSAKAAVAIPATTRFAYDAMDRQVFQADALGVVTKYGYDERGNRTSQIDAYAELTSLAGPLEEGNMTLLGAGMQRAHAYAYDLIDRLRDEAQPAGTVVHYDYNAAGELAAKTVDFGAGAEFRNAATRYFYDSAGRMQFEVDPVGNVTHYEYDAFGNRIRITAGLALAGGVPSTAPTPDSRTTAYAYDGADRLIAEIVDPAGLRLVTRHEYDARGNQVALTDANGHRGESLYDAADRLVWQRDAEGNVAAFAYDARGNKIRETRYAGPGSALAPGETPAGTAQDRTTHFSYDGLDRLVERVDPRDIVNRLAYDAAGNVIENLENATSLHGASARRRTMEYSVANLVTREVDHASGLVTSYEYDRVYNLTREVRENTWLDTLAPGGAVTRTELQVTAYDYDLNNRLIAETGDPDGLALRRQYRYDALGNRIAETDGNGNTTRTYFDAAGRPVFMVDPLGNVRSAHYDARDNLVRAVQYATPLSAAQLAALDDHAPPPVVPDATADRTVEHAYDKADRMIETRLDAVRSYVGGQWVDGHQPTTTRAYDGVGNLVRETGANGHTTYRYYDSNGLEIGTLDAEGYLAVNTYDAFGNRINEALYLDRPVLTEIEKRELDLGTFVPSGDARVYQYEYDLAGNEIRKLCPPGDLFLNGQESSSVLQELRTYDAFGNLLSETVKHRPDDTNPAFKTLRYDAAGRLALEVDARAEELIASDSGYFLALRRDLGYVNADGTGKLAHALTDAERAAIREAFTTTYSYDAAGNLRERIEGARVTTFEYDAANRNTRIHLPAAEAVAVDADGNMTTTAEFRFVAEVEYDAAGNVIRELKADGHEIRYHYDRANRQIAAIDQNNVYTEYGYNFAGDRTLTRRYFVPAADRNDPAPPAAHTADQLIEFDYDRAGRLIRERHAGDFSTETDNRVVQMGYDPNGNQVEVIDGRGNTSRIIYDALNRMIGTVNPSGGLTTTVYDAMGNIVARQTGGFAAPSLVGGTVERSLLSSEGLTLLWQTSHATDGEIFVRRAGSTDPYMSFGATGFYSALHEVSVSGLAADTEYEYFLVSRDAFGFTLTTTVQTFRTAAGVDGAVITDLQPAAGGFTANLNFALPPSAQNPVVAVGVPGEDRLTLDSEALFAPVQNADGSYTAALAFADAAQAHFQIRWTVGTEEFATAIAPVEQRQELQFFDGTLRAVPLGEEGFALTVTWDLSQALAGGAVRTYVDDGGVTRHNVYIGITRDPNEEPVFVEAQLNEAGSFQTDFPDIADGAWNVDFYYVTPEGNIVTAARQSVPSLADLDTRIQRLELAFPDIDTSGKTLRFSYRAAGASEYTELSAGAINGLSVDVLGLAEGDYEFKAELLSGASVLRTSLGAFSLREPAEADNLVAQPLLQHVVDAANPQAPGFAFEDTVLVFPDLVPLAADEAIELTVTDAGGTGTVHPFDDGRFDFSVLSAGDYALHIVKTRIATTVVDGEPITTTTVLNDITGTLTVPAPVTAAVSDNVLTVDGLAPLGDGESLVLEATDGNATTIPIASTDGTFDLTALAPGDYTIRIVKTRTETVDGVPVTTVLNDIRGEVHVEPLVLTHAAAEALSGVRTLTSYNLAPPGPAPVGASTAGSSTTADHIYNFYDHNGWKTFSNENAGVWTRYFYDTQGNISKEVRFKYRDPATGEFVDHLVDLEQRPEVADLEANYQAAVAAHDPAAGLDTVRTIERTFDAAGNQLAETSVSQAYERITDSFRYDRFGNKTRAVTSEGIAGQELAIEYVYDARDRLVRVTTGPFQYFDSDGNGYFDTASIVRTYDRFGNQSSETNERGYLKRSHYDAAHRLAREWDPARVLADGSLGSSGLKTDYAYDAFGRMTAKTAHDLTGRGAVGSHATTIEYDNYDQVTRHAVAGETNSFAYDRAGNKMLTTNARGFTERFVYDAENRVIAHVDRLGHVSGKSYDAYGHVISEADGTGRTTTYTIGAFGQVLEQRTTLIRGIEVNTPPDSRVEKFKQLAEGGGFLSSLFAVLASRLSQGGERNLQRGRASYTETTSYDWLGNRLAVQDSYGKNWAYGYDDLDRLTAAHDLAKDQLATYSYDSRGRRVGETLTRDGTVLRSQTNSYNRLGWLTGVDTEAGLSFAGSTLEQAANVAYFYDQAGNRVRVGDNRYTYDGAGRMTFAFDGKANQTIEGIEYDGFGNRVSLHQGASTVTYTYDGRHRVVSSSRGETWTYDEVGNQLSHRAANGDTQTTEYNAENRPTRTVSTADGKTTTTIHHYDAAGNIGVTDVRGGDFGFHEVTFRDVRYDETLKRIENGWANGAAGLRGETQFTYDTNGQLTFLDRGRKNSARENTVATFGYDNEGHILHRADAAVGGLDAAFFQGFLTDPDADASFDESGFGSPSTTARIRRELFGGNFFLPVLEPRPTNLNAYVYVEGRPVAEARSEHHIDLKKLTLQGATPLTEPGGFDENGFPITRIVGYRLTLIESDIARTGGLLDRDQTARNIALRAYQGFAGLHADTQARVIAYLEGQLPASDGDVQAGAEIELHGYILLIDGQYQNTRVVTDQFVRQIGDGVPQGQAITYLVQGGDTLQAIASQYYGSPHYWYLIAEANGLSGTEELKEGSTLTIPNRVANSLNNSDTYRLYNENEIIGSTSPEVVTIPKKKKRGFLRRLVQIVITIVIVVVAVYVAAYLGPEVFGIASASLGGGVAGFVAGTVAAAATGYTVGVATSFATQGLAILAGLQDKFDWKAARAMGKGFAISAAAGGLADWATTEINSPALQSLAKGGIEYGSQTLKDGEITNRSGLLLAFVPGARTLAQQDKWFTAPLKFLDQNKSTVSTGLSLLETSRKGSANTLDWVGAAVGAIGGQLGQGAGPLTRLTAGGVQFNWARIGQEALVAGLGALVVAGRYGTDAGISFFGGRVGQSLGGALVERAQASDDLGFVTTAQYQQLVNDPNLTEAQRRQLLGQLADRNRAGSLVLAAGERDDEQAQVPPDAREFQMNERGQLVDAQGRPAPVMLASAGDVTGVVDESYGLLPSEGVGAAVSSSATEASSEGGFLDTTLKVLEKGVQALTAVVTAAKEVLFGAIRTPLSFLYGLGAGFASGFSSTRKRGGGFFEALGTGLARGAEFGVGAAGASLINTYHGATFRLRNLARSDTSITESLANLAGEIPLVGHFLTGGTRPDVDATGRVYTAVSSGVAAYGLTGPGGDITRSESFVGATRTIAAGMGQAPEDVFQTRYAYGTPVDTAFSILGLSHAYAYTAAQQILDRGVSAGDTVNFVAHSGGAQRLAMASRILGDYGVYGNALASITGPVVGSFNNLDTIGLVGSRGEFTSNLQYGLRDLARAANGAKPHYRNVHYERFEGVDFVSSTIEHRTPQFGTKPDQAYFDYLRQFLQSYGAPNSR